MSAASSRRVAPHWGSVRRWLLVATLILGVNGVTYATVTRPHLTSRDNASAVHDRVEGMRTELVRRMESFLDTHGDAVDVGVDLGRLVRSIDLAGSSIAAMTESIHGLVTASGLEIQRMNFSVEELPELGLRELMADVPVRGSYEELRRFVELVRIEPLFIVLEQIAIHDDTLRRGRTNELNITLALSGFVTDAGGAPTWRAIDALDQDGAEAESSAGESGGQAAATLLRRLERLEQRLRDLPQLGGGVDLPQLDLDRLAAPVGRAPSEGRNPFEYRTSAATATRPERETPPPPVQRQTPKTSEPTAAGPLAVPFKLIGLVSVGDSRMGTFLLNGEMILAREGEIVADGFRLTNVGLVGVTVEKGGRQATLQLPQ